MFSIIFIYKQKILIINYKEGGDSLKKYSVITVFIIAIAISITIYNLSFEQFVGGTPVRFGTINFLDTFMEVYAQNKGRVSDNAQLIARAINGEARGESYEGQVAVGAVILNRTQDSKFPKTVPGVIYQPGAFSAVSDGQINLSLSTNSTPYKAARDALNGWDPTGGCIYYFNPSTATNSWIWSRPQSMRIGKHIFAK